MARTKQLRLVEAHGQRLTTTSLLVAEKFNKRHDNVLQKIDGLIASQPEFGRLNFKAVEYLDQKGEARKSYEMTEEGFAMIAMRFTGKAAEEWQIKFVSAFQAMRRIITEPGRKEELQAKRNTGSEMAEAIKLIRELDGKQTAAHHYLNENLFCNWVLTGLRQPIDESTLGAYEMRLLAAIRRHNTLLMIRYQKQADRKALMAAFVADYRKKHPHLTLVGGRHD